ncbi:MULTISPECIES: hypothetical protein [Enterobacterales]|uniref:hypothetical protein n=1 Tax=Enterobacterales TaxID=91347 RepID=UPI002ED7ABBD
MSIKTKEIAAKIESLTSQFPRYAGLEIDGELAGYICQNNSDSGLIKPFSLVGIDGKNVGDYCCMDHAVRAAAQNKYPDAGVLVGDADKAGVLKKMLLMGLLGALAETFSESEEESNKEKSPHEAG